MESQQFTRWVIEEHLGCISEENRSKLNELLRDCQYERKRYEMQQLLESGDAQSFIASKHIDFSEVIKTVEKDETVNRSEVSDGLAIIVLILISMAMLAILVWRLLHI